MSRVLISATLFLFLSLPGLALQNETIPSNDFRDRLSRLESSIYLHDPALSREVDMAKSEIDEMLHKTLLRCRSTDAIGVCARFRDMKSWVVTSEKNIASGMRDAVRVFVLPTDLSLGGASRMAINSKESRTILIDLQSWRDLSVEKKQLLFYVEFARFINFESEEQRYLAVAQVMDFINRGQDLDDSKKLEVSFPRFFQDQADVYAAFPTSGRRYNGTVIQQGGKIFFALSDVSGLKTTLYTLNPEATAINPQCFAAGSEDLGSYSSFVKHEHLDIAQMGADLCRRSLGKQNRYPLLEINILPKLGLISNCFPRAGRGSHLEGEGP